MLKVNRTAVADERTHDHSKTVAAPEKLQARDGEFVDFQELYYEVLDRQLKLSQVGAGDASTMLPGSASV